MKTLVLVTLTVCATMLSTLAGCAEQTTGTTSSIHYTAVPAPLSASIESALRGISQAKPLSPELRETVRTAVETIKNGNPRRSMPQMGAIRKVGYGAIPLLADLLSSQDDLLRTNSMVALGSLAPAPGKRTKYYSDKIEPVLTLLSQRSLLDRNVRVRMLALGLLFTTGYGRRGDVPEGVVAGLEQALSDPDERIRQEAQVFKEWLGLAPRDPSHGVP